MGEGMKRYSVSPILSAAAGQLMPRLMIFSIFLLIRGHNEPGGGFVGGLVASASFTLYAVASGLENARRALRAEPRHFIFAGLATMLASGLLSVVMGKPFLTGLWLGDPVPVVGKLGTPFLFDTGVYLLIVGVTSMITFSLMEE
jgi:multicomponent Na+:H+ antiporter subunit B